MEKSKTAKKRSRSEVSSVITSSRIMPAQLETLDHAVANLSKSVQTIIKLCPELVEIGDDKSEGEDYNDHGNGSTASNNNNSDSHVDTLLKEPRILFARALKKAYLEGKLGLFDTIMNANDYTGQKLETNLSSFMFDFDPSPFNTRSLASLSGAPDDTHRARKSKKPKKNKEENEWPPKLPDIHDRNLLRQVFTHKSVANERRQHLSKEELVSKHNERLEFIGDAVLGFIVSNMVYEWFPDASEGDLTSMRSLLVCNDTLWDWANMYGLQERLETRFELNGEVEGKKSKIISDTMEAYIGGIYMDPRGGPRVVKEWIQKLLQPMMTELDKERQSIEPLDKEAKQTLYQQIGSQHLTPQYHTVMEGDGEMPFTVECRMDSEVIGVGSASNLKNAGIRAAMMALKNTKIIEKYSEMRRKNLRPTDSASSSGLQGQAIGDVSSTRPYSTLTNAAAGLTDSLDAMEVSPSSSGAGKSASKKTNSGPKDRLYSLIGSADHRPVYTTVREGSQYVSRCHMHKDLLGQGRGSSKKEAEHKAAEEALANDTLLQKWVTSRRGTP